MAKFFKRLHEGFETPDRLKGFDPENPILPQGVSLDDLLGFSCGEISHEGLLALLKLSGVDPSRYIIILNGFLHNLGLYQSAETVKPDLVKILAFLKGKGPSEAIKLAEKAAKAKEDGEGDLMNSGATGTFTAEAIRFRAALDLIIKESLDRDKKTD